MSKHVRIRITIPLEVTLYCPDDVEVRNDALAAGVNDDGYSDGRHHHDWEVIEDMVSRYLVKRGLFSMLRENYNGSSARAECTLDEIHVTATMKEEITVADAE